MKQLFTLALILFTAGAYGQTNTTDSTIKVLYADTKNSQKQPAFFVNGNFVGNALSIKPGDIDSISVIKEDFEFESVKYYGQIHIVTKKDCTPKLISLTAIKGKYSNLGKKPVIFTIDGNIVNSDYDKYVVDENNLLQIIVDKISIAEENVDLGLIKLLTKSEENIKKSKEIRIRGSEVITKAF